MSPLEKAAFAALPTGFFAASGNLFLAIALRQQLFQTGRKDRNNRPMKSR